jgi:predicted ATPase/DNA-binding CsgD family transcriptional regulator
METADAAPVALTSFIGRHGEIAELIALLGDRRLVTITGPGGCGKTRLALEVLARLGDGRRDGLAWVDLAVVNDGSLVAAVAADALKVPVGPTSDPIVAIASALRDRAMVVCFDNCEHVVGAAGELAERILAAGTNVSVLATSREPLGSAAETVWRAPPMVDEDVLALFVDRARSARADFPLDAPTLDAVATLCRRLDGIPLAVELAAAWVRSLTPAQIAAALDDRFELLVGSHRRVLPRHRTLRASVDWSYDLLGDDARTLLARLSVFAGSFTLDDVLAVCADDALGAEQALRALTRLVDTSMVTGDTSGAVARYGLTETIRDYGTALLADAGATTSFRGRHLRHFTEVATHAAIGLDTGDQDEALAHLHSMDQNLRAALEWGLAATQPELGCRLAAALAHMWFLRGRTREGLDALDRALARCPEDQPSLRAQLLVGQALVAIPAGRMELNAGAAMAAIELGTAIDDVRIVARATATAGYVPFYSDYRRCEELGRAAQALGREADEPFAVDFGMLLQATSLANRDLHAEVVPVADELYERTRARHDRIGAFSRNVRLYGALLTGDVRGAIAFGRAAVELAQPLRDYFVDGTVTSDLAWAVGAAGDLDEARRLLDRLVRSIDHAGPDVDVIGLRVTAGKLLVWAGEYEEALPWLERAAQFDEPGTDNWTAMRALPTLAVALHRLGRHDDGAVAAQRGIDMAQRLGTPHVVAESVDALAHVNAATDPGRAESLFHEALSIRAEHDLRTHIADSLDALARLVADRGDHPQAARLTGAADAGRHRSSYPRPVADTPAHAALLADVRAALGEHAFTGLVREGTALGLDDAIAYATRGRGPRGRPSIGWESLTPTEREVAALVAEGLTNPQIAERLFVGRATVKTHVSHIFAKVGVTTRAALAAAARDRDVRPSL